MTALWPWQTDAINFAVTKPATVLNMDMGTGKSFVALDLCTKRWGARRVLISAPLSTISDNAWGKQLREHAPDVDALLLDDRYSAKKKAELATDAIRSSGARGRKLVVAVNHDSAWRPVFKKHALSAGYEALIVDESHKAKAPRGKLSSFLAEMGRAIRARRGHTLLLTGTLMPHSPLDVWAQFRIFNPDVLGFSFVRFRARYAVLGGFENRQVVRFQNLDELRARIAPYVFQVGREVLNFPDPILSTVTVDLAPATLKAYDEMKKHLVTEINRGEVTAANGMVKLLRLQQFTSGWAKVDGVEGVTRIDSAKLDALTEIFEGTAEEPVVVFGRFSGDLVTVKDAARATGRPAFELSGATKDLDAWDRMARAPRSPGQPAPVMGVQIQAGGTGIDLTAAGVGVYLSTGYSMGDFDQSKARIDRPGRKPVVRYIHVVARGTVDESVASALSARRDLVDAVLTDLQRETSHA